MRYILLLPLLWISSQLLAQAPATPAVFAETITAEDLREHLTIIAADDMEGRETGQPGLFKAARYLEEQVKGMGIPGVGEEETYSQPISFISERWSKIELSVDGEDKRHLWDFYAYPSKNAERDQVDINEVTFLGYGIESDNYNDYSGQNVEGKTILIFAGEPRRKGVSVVTGTAADSKWATDMDMKLRAAKRNGVETVIVIDPDFQKNLSSVRKIALDSRMRMAFSENAAENYANSIFITSELAKDIIGSSFGQVVKTRKKIEKKGKPRSLTIPVDLSLIQKKNVRELLGENIMAFIEGSDPERKHEVLAVTAHYDHVGTRGKEVFNGADDNGSGTSTLLEVCQAFVAAKAAGQGPKRSILFMWVSGEEKGLLGSKFYVEHPVFPLDNTIANINVDMVGRVDEKHADNPNYIYVIGSNRLSTELHDINETANSTYTQLELDYTYNAKDDPNRFYYRSDHYNFAERGIPAVFFFNGTHEDYHQITDTVEKINFDKMAIIGQLIFHTAWELANREQRIVVDVKD